MTPYEVFVKLRDQGIRIFKISLHREGRNKECYFVHPDKYKTTPRWRKDVRAFYKDMAPKTNFDGYAVSVVDNDFFRYLGQLGYIELDDVLADVFECRITNESARLVDDPDHEDQKDGFGHYTTETKQEKTKENKLSGLKCFCEQCNDDRDFLAELRKETHRVHNANVPVKLSYIACSVCGYTKPDPRQDKMLTLYQTYHKIYKSWRYNPATHTYEAPKKTKKS